MKLIIACMILLTTIATSNGASNWWVTCDVITTNVLGYGRFDAGSDPLSRADGKVIRIAVTETQFNTVAANWRQKIRTLDYSIYTNGLALAGANAATKTGMTTAPDGVLVIGNKGARVYGRLDMQSNDVEYDPDQGVILTYSDGSKWLLVLEEPVGTNTLCDVFAVKIAASPELSMSERKARVSKLRADRKAVRDLWRKNGQLQEKINVLAKMHGLETE